MRQKGTLVASAAIAACIAIASFPVQARELIQNKGSDTLVNVAQAWAEAYQTINPEVAVAVSGGGSGTGIAAMINGTVDIANASRAMKQKEIDLAKSSGQDPMQHIVGYDALAEADLALHSVVVQLGIVPGLVELGARGCRGGGRGLGRWSWG